MKAETESLLEQLIGFETISSKSNLELIDYIKNYLDDRGVSSELTFDQQGQKANLFATFGDKTKSGLVLSGHTDVVPVQSQDWNTDPFVLTAKDNCLYGRGAADMKSFIAVCLSFSDEILRRKLKHPLHFAFSFDEEVGCVGVRHLLTELSKRPVKPFACIVGEPTSMRPVRAHKGGFSERCIVHGLSCHSSLTHQGVNAVEAAAALICKLKSMAERVRNGGPFDEGFEPPYTTIHTGVVQGGTALNIVPKECWFDYEIRNLPGESMYTYADEIHDFAKKELLPAMREISGAADIEWQSRSEYPAMSISDEADILQLVKALTSSDQAGMVSFGTEGGLFQEAGIPSVVCGPGHIEQAHKPNEYIEVSQIEACERFIADLLDHLSA